MCFYFHRVVVGKAVDEDDTDWRSMLRKVDHDETVEEVVSSAVVVEEVWELIRLSLCLCKFLRGVQI